MGQTWTNVNETVDGSTGEVLRSERSYTTRTTTELFTQLFHEHPDFADVFKISRLRDLHVLLKLCQLCEYDTGRVKFGKTEREEVGKALTMSLANLSGSISRLRALGLISGRGSEIQLNARLFWKGSSKIRRKTIEQLYPGTLPPAE